MQISSRDPQRLLPQTDRNFLVEDDAKVGRFCLTAKGTKKIIIEPVIGPDYIGRTVKSSD
jgi:hypothetical protein